MDQDNYTKRCSRCKQDKSPDEFHVNRAQNDGRHPHCKLCRQEERKGEHSPNHAKTSRKYYYSHKEQCKAAAYAWRANNIEKSRASKRLSEKNRNARKRSNGTGTVTQKQIDEMYVDQNGRCKYCPAELRHGFHVDHRMPIARGGVHDISNIQLLCSHCNTSKKATPPEEYERRIGYVVS